MPKPTSLSDLRLSLRNCEDSCRLGYVSSRLHGVTSQKIILSMFYLSWHFWIRETAAGRPHAWVLTLWAPKTAVATPLPADKLRRTLLHRVVYLNPVPRGCFQECHLCGFTAFLKKAWYFCVLLPLVYIERSSVPRGIDRGSGTCRRSGINIYDRVVNYIA